MVTTKQVALHSDLVSDLVLLCALSNLGLPLV